MKLCLNSKNWYQNKSEGITWGKADVPLPYSLSLSSTCVNIRSSEFKIQPLVGILVSKGKRSHFSGNRAALKRIQLLLQKSGGLSFVFTPNDWSTTNVNGYFYDFNKEKWLKAFFPIPDVVYNRIPFRKNEKTSDFNAVISQLHKLNIPYFNKCFFEKWDIHQLLSTNTKLQTYLPHTKKLDSIDNLSSMLEQYNRVYLKPIQGKKGKGILVVQKNNNNLYDIESIEERKQSVSLKAIFDDYVLPSSEYIVQQAIEPLKWRGSRFDYRILVHRKSEDAFTISGIGVRQSKKQQVTTHVPFGGTIVPFAELPFTEDRFEIKAISNEIGKMLIKQYGAIGEFSIDIGKQADGRLYIFEVNSKPMVFDENDIRQNGLTNLVGLFQYFTTTSNEKHI